MSNPTLDGSFPADDATGVSLIIILESFYDYYIT